MIFLKSDTKNKSNKSKNKQWDYIKLKNFHRARETIHKTKSYLSPKMCYVGCQLGSLFYSAASFKAREIKAREEILREFWFSPLPDLISLSKWLREI